MSLTENSIPHQQKEGLTIGQASMIIVGATGFEPTTPCSQSRCANRTALRPEKDCSFAKPSAKIRFYGETTKKFLGEIT